MSDVLIIGNGPAGLASAITLQQQGISVTVVHRPEVTHTIRVGESLAASARYSLTELGVWDDFFTSGHSPCYGNASCWGDDKLFCYDFIHSTAGEGWYIDRLIFREMMLQKAMTVGAKFIETNRIFQLTREGNNWQYSDDQLQINARMIIDASGRNSWLSRQLGVKRIRRDNQIAVVCLLRASDPMKNGQSLIEAVHDGWWYISDIGEGKVVRIFFTDPDLHDRTDWLNPSYWSNKSLQTHFVKHRIPVSRYIEILPLQYTSAGSHHLEWYAAKGWLAVGDAACSLDPLSSHGIAFALRSGIDAGLVVKDCLSGVLSAENDYHEKIQLAFQLYQEQRQDIYLKEMRWADYPYWKRRQNDQFMIKA
jgi:flavin-dependent dehydrogenase